ncbi:patatin-like phospholipase family protein, partial [Escherichia coli]|nr:patatin-like phospholipase family protein [Escherichia coli]
MARPNTALLLTGGGARAAYQVGALKAIAELYPRNLGIPFPILCGTSAGAINVT